MKRKVTALSHRYASALRKHLKQGPKASLQPARGLGRQAAALGLETLDLARIHEEALASLDVHRSREGIIKRAVFFFNEANSPIEETHRAARQAKVQLGRLKTTLGTRTEKLAATNRSLKEGVAQHKAAEDVLRKSGGRFKKLLKKSHRLQKYLQQLTHRILSAQEDKRKKISHNLQDEIAQTLLGINVRLLTLKQTAIVKGKVFKKDIASAQRLVEESVQSINRFARELDSPQPVRSESVG